MLYKQGIYLGLIYLGFISSVFFCKIVSGCDFKFQTLVKSTTSSLVKPEILWLNQFW